jgi:hypothetical protein
MRIILFSLICAASSADRPAVGAVEAHFFAADGFARGISRAACGIAAGLSMQLTRAWRNW